MSEFEEQLKQEELAREQSETSNDREYTDADGTVYEWDDQKNAWFPKVDEDFIAKYQMNYGVDQSKDKSESDKSESQDQKEYSQEEYDKYWKDYYSYYGQLPEQGTQEQSEDGTDLKTEESGQEGTTGKSTTEKDETYDPDDHYSNYFSQYYDEKYVANAKENEKSMTKDEGKNSTKSDDRKSKQKEGKVGDKRKPQTEEGWVEIDDDKNTNVYVSGLPLDITDEEFNQFMTKCGLIMPDLMTKEPKIKLYRDDNNEPKGDGRCCYLKVESVILALQILDGGDLRGHTVHVERAKFTMKGNFDPKKKRKKLSAKEKKKRVQQQRKMLDWKPELDDSRKRWEKVVVLKQMFDPKDFEEDPLLINELREDVREECSKFGEVKKVMLYDRHPEGVMTVHLKEFEDAETCITALNGRWFAKKQISAEIWDGKTKYEIEESTAERDERLKKWENFLETDDTKTDQKSEKLPEAEEAASTAVVVNTDSTKATESGVVVNTDSTKATESGVVVNTDSTKAASTAVVDNTDSAKATESGASEIPEPIGEESNVDRTEPDPEPDPASFNLESSGASEAK